MAQNAKSGPKKKRTGFAGRIAECETNYDILRLVREFAKAHGYDYFLIARLPEKSDRQIAAISIVNNWPVELIAGYDKLNMLEKSPAIKALRKSTRPFHWTNEPPTASAQDHPGMDYFNLFDQHGIRNGVHIPVQQASGQRGTLTLAGMRNPPLEAEMMELSYYGNLIYNRIADIRSGDASPEQTPLSMRERECLQWTASGKTSQEIAMILELSEHTVNHYLSAACQKLGAVNRAHAVAKAIRAGVLD